MADDMRADDLRFMPVGPPAAGRRRAELPQLVQPLPAVLPGPRIVPHRPLRPQPPCLLARSPLWLPVLRRPCHARHRAAGQRLPDRLHREVPQRVRRATLQGHRQVVVPLRPQRLDRLVRRGLPAPAQRLQRGRHVQLHAHALQRERPDRRHASRRVPDRRAGPVRAQARDEVPPLPPSVLPLPLVGRAALRPPHEKGDPCT